MWQIALIDCLLFFQIPKYSPLVGSYFKIRVLPFPYRRSCSSSQQLVRLTSFDTFCDFWLEFWTTLNLLWLKLQLSSTHRLTAMLIFALAFSPSSCASASRRQSGSWWRSSGRRLSSGVTERSGSPAARRTCWWQSSAISSNGYGLTVSWPVRNWSF